MTAAVIHLETEETIVRALGCRFKELAMAVTSAAVIAWHAGDEARTLIERYGWSQRRIAKEYGVHLRTVQRCLEVTRRRVSHHSIKMGETIESIIGEEGHAARDKKAKATRAAAFDKTDAEHTIKLHRLATKNDNPHEAAVAKKKLDGGWRCPVHGTG